MKQNLFIMAMVGFTSLHRCLSLHFPIMRNVFLDFSASIVPKGLLELDKRLFHFLNGTAIHPLLDNTYPWWREGITWTPLYLFFLLHLLLSFGNRALPWVLFALVNVGLTDQVSSGFVKHWAMRARPCADPNLGFQVRLLLDHCSGGYSFTSSHAANHFGFAMYAYRTLRHIRPKFRALLFIWAASIAYGQVYVGVHFPLDIFFGALLGCGIGYFSSTVFLNRAFNWSLFGR